MKPNPNKQLQEPGAVRLVRNSSFVAAGQGSALLLYLVYVLAARALGEAAFGVFTLSLVIASLLFNLPAWGTAKYTPIVAAREPTKTGELLELALGLSVFLVLLYLPLVWVTSSVVSDDTAVLAASMLLGGDLALREYGQLLRLLFRVHAQYERETVAVYLERGFVGLGAATSLLIQPGPVSLAFGFFTGRLLGASVTTLLFARRVTRFRIRFERERARGFLVEGAPLAARRALGELSFRLDVLLLGIMRSSSELGWYGSVTTLLSGVVMLPTIVTGSLGPTISANFGAGRTSAVIRLFDRALKYIVVGGVYLGSVFLLLSDPIVLTLYGAEYALAAPALAIVSLSAFFLFVRRYLNEIMDNVDLRESTVRIFTIGCVANLLLNLFLIPAYGFLGAAGASVATEAFLMIAMLRVLHSRGFYSNILRHVRIASSAIVAPAVLMHLLVERPLIAAGAAAFAYAFGLLTLGMWDKKDRQLARSIASVIRARVKGPAVGI